MSLQSVTSLTVLLLVVAPNTVCPTPVAYESGNDDVVLYGVNGLVAYVNKKGANVRVHRDLNGTGNNNEHGFGETGAVEIFLDTIEELDANLEKLNGNHKTSSFANVDFLIETVYNVSLPLSVSSNVTADCLNCSATLDKVGLGAKISMAVCAINKDATLDMNGELTNVTAGQVKITFTMVDWPWAEGYVTNKLAVDIVIKVPPGRCVNVSEDTDDKPAHFTLGDDSFVEFSRMVYEDGMTWKQMPSGYPKYTSNGANNHFTLVLGHFVKSSIYDPNLEVGYQSDQSTDNGNNGNNGHRSAPQLLSVALLAVLSMVSIRIL